MPLPATNVTVDVIYVPNALARLFINHHYNILCVAWCQ